MLLPDDILIALDRFARSRNLSRADATLFILVDWLMREDLLPLREEERTH